MGRSSFCPVLSPRECRLTFEPKSGNLSPGWPPNQKYRSNVNVCWFTSSQITQPLGFAS